LAAQQPVSVRPVPATSHYQDAGRLPAVSADQPRAQSGPRFLKVQHAYWDSELDYRWCGKNVEASVGREGSLKLLIYIKKNIR